MEITKKRRRDISLLLLENSSNQRSLKTELHHKDFPDKTGLQTWQSWSKQVMKLLPLHLMFLSPCGPNMQLVIDFHMQVYNHSYISYLLDNLIRSISEGFLDFKKEIKQVIQ